MSDSNIRHNAKQAISLEQFIWLNEPDNVGHIDLRIPADRQYVLRMPISRYYSGWKVPKELQWCMPIIEMADNHQKNSVGVNHAFSYLTVRSGIVESETDDVWHVDGFSMKITHLPEQNYIWSNCDSTEYVTEPIEFPTDFDPLIHNVHLYIQKKVANSLIKKCLPKHVYGLDPYVIHRRPPMTKGTQRTFVRVSFTPIEILDKNNAFNPELPTVSDRDGVEIRNQLREYQ